MVKSRRSSAGVGTLDEALMLHQQGKLREAEGLYRGILAIDRGNFEALTHLGLICLQYSNLNEATKLFSEALDHNSNCAQAHSNLANAFLAASQFEKAMAGYRRALAIEPDHPEANFGLASALQAMKRYADAISAFEKTLAIDPDYAEANYSLAVALQALQRPGEAIAYYEKALAIDPDYTEANYGLASALQILHRSRHAIPFYEKVLAIDPDHAEANDGLGTALQALNQHDKAIRFYKRALAIKPGYAAAQNNLGVALAEIGRLDEACVAFERAIDLEPRRAGFYRNLFDTKKNTPQDRHLAALEALAKDAALLPAEDQIQMHFALGKALADIGEPRRSFRHILEGNTLKREQTLYDKPAELQLLDRIRVVFTEGLMRSKAGHGHPSSLPVFIVGMPRSGSTLVEQILATHPRVFGAGERLDLGDALNSFGAATKGVHPFPELFTNTTGEDLHRLGADYLDRLNTASQTGSLWQSITDKVPANFRLVGIIHLALPNARIIHTCRDPVDTCLSCFSTLFAADQPFAYDLGELGRYYRAYSSLMEHWRRVLPESVMIDVRYEELVVDFEMLSRRIVAHCGLEWDEACLAYEKAARPVKTASSAQVRRPIYHSSIGRWRPILDLIQPLLDGLGPDLTRNLTPPGSR